MLAEPREGERRLTYTLNTFLSGQAQSNIGKVLVTLQPAAQGVQASLETLKWANYTKKQWFLKSSKGLELLGCIQK